MAVFHPSDLVSLADRLRKDGSEASDRTAISRAYYGIFLMARDLMGVSVRDGRAHRLTQDKLRRCGQAELSIDLAFLRGLRNESDYQTDRNITAKSVSDALDTAWRMHRKLNRLRSKASRRGQAR
ncbi:hypothetical protein [Roseateles sp. MS654]|uniref:hypothetical protein n=1 Tax=Roseateles sp. MS654 TaxID=3412685 RepID=UPI003C2EA804